MHIHTELMCPLRTQSNLNLFRYPSVFLGCEDTRILKHVCPEMCASVKIIKILCEMENSRHFFLFIFCSICASGGKCSRACGSCCVFKRVTEMDVVGSLRSNHCEGEKQSQRGTVCFIGELLGVFNKCISVSLVAILILFFTFFYFFKWDLIPVFLWWSRSNNSPRLNINTWKSFNL